MPTTSPNLGLTLPTPNVDTGWGSTLNTDFTIIDNVFAAAGTGPSVGLNVGSGKTLNIAGTLRAQNIIILGGGDGTGTTTAPVIRGAARTGTNEVGVNLTIDAPNGTGTGGSGSIIFRTAPPGANGSTPNTMQTAMEIKSNGTVQIGGGDVSPTGTVVAYAGGSAPAGWLLCAGQSVSISTYAALFAVVGYTYGGGGGSFNLPDLRGRVVAGKDDMNGVSANRLTSVLNSNALGGSGGDQLHTLTIAQIPPHTHTARSYTNLAPYGGNARVAWEGSEFNYETGSQGGGQAHNNVQPTFILNYIIKA